MSKLDQYSVRPVPSSGPSRGIPPGAAVTIAFGGIFNGIGWGVFGFAMIFWWLFGTQADLASHFQFDERTRTTTGRVVEVTQTSYSEGGSKSTPGTPIFRYDFEYDLGDGVARRDTCYTRGQQHHNGAAVTVEYVLLSPPVARIQGARRKVFGAETLFVAIFPLVGLGLIAGGTLAGLRTLAVLRRGRLAMGRLVDRKPTNTTINKQRVYALTFEFNDDKGRPQRATIRTHHTHKVEDEAEERLFYDPQNPWRARMADLLPRGISVQPDGSLHFRGGTLQLALAVGLPLVVLVVHGLVAVAMYL